MSHSSFLFWLLTIIDLGCGNFPLTSYLFQEICKIININLNLTLLDKSPNPDQKIQFLDYKNFSSFSNLRNSIKPDVILASDLLYFEKDFDYVLACCKYLAEPGMTKIFMVVEIRDSKLPLILKGYFERWGFEFEVIFDTSIQKDELDFEDEQLSIDPGKHLIFYLLEVL